MHLFSSAYRPGDKNQNCTRSQVPWLPTRCTASLKMLTASRLNIFFRTSCSLFLAGRANCNSVGSCSSIQTIARGATTAFSSRKRNNTQGIPKRPKSSTSKSLQHSYFSNYVSKHFIPAPGEVESFLNRHRVNYRCNETHATIEECPFCHPTKGKPDNLYALGVERTSGVFKCHRCKMKGNWFDLKRKFSAGVIGPMFSDGEESLTQEESMGAKPVANEKKPTPSLNSQKSFVRNLWNQEDSRARSYLNEKRGLQDEVLKKYGIGCGNFDIIAGRDLKPKERCITFPMYDGNGRLVRQKIRPIESKSGMRLSPKGGNWGLFGFNTVPRDAKSVVVTEGEFDAMSVHQCTGRPAISVPNGASSLPLELLPCLERFDRIYLWMDEDEPGQTGAETFSRKLGAKRCLSVRGLHVEGKPCKDANDGLLRNIDLEALIQRAERVQHSSLVKFQDIRDQVLADLNNIQDPNVVRTRSIPRLHELMKGLRPGELTILSGQTGCGKTTLLSQLSLDYCVQNVPTLWGSFEMDNARLAGKLLQQFHAVYDKGTSNLIDMYDYWADRFAELPFYFMRYHGSNPVEQVIETMDFAHYMYDCQHVILDNLQFMSFGQRARSQFEVLDNAVAQLREFSTQKKVHITLVVHPRKTEEDEKLEIASVYGSAKATQEADNILLLQKTNEGRRLEVKKNRFDGSLGSIPLKFNRKRLMFSQSDSCGAWLGWDSDRLKQEQDSKTLEKIAAVEPNDSRKGEHREAANKLGDELDIKDGVAIIEPSDGREGEHGEALSRIGDELDIGGEGKHNERKLRKFASKEDEVRPQQDMGEDRERDMSEKEQNNSSKVRGRKERVQRHLKQEKQRLRLRSIEEGGGWVGMGSTVDKEMFLSRMNSTNTD